MPRVLETEIMTNLDSVQGYTEMTVTAPNLVTIFLIPELTLNKSVLKIADIGCGPCGYHNELYALYPNAIIDAYEASEPMLIEATKYVNSQKTNLIQALLPEYPLPQAEYDLVISSMFLHQLPDDSVNWNAIKQLGKPGAQFIMYDLLRVENDETCWEIVNGITSDAPTAFKKDFFNSLRAAFSVDEIKEQLECAGLNASVKVQNVYSDCSVICVRGTL